jgi:uncharacterized protein (TIGR01777 family)
VFRISSEWADRRDRPARDTLTLGATAVSLHVQAKTPLTLREIVLRTPVPVSAQRLFDWHMRPGAFERLSPPWGAPVVTSPWSRPVTGQDVEMQVPVLPGVRIPWTSHIAEVREGEMFRDVQTRGPFASFDHTHRFEAVSDTQSVMEDRIRYTLPLGPLGDLFGSGHARATLGALLAYRHRVLARDLQVHARASRGPLRILVTGATGLVGRALIGFLETGGHEVHRLTRRAAQGPREIEFDPARGAAHPSEMEGFDAVIHLAGDPIAKGRWTEEKKRLIRDSRVPFTRRLAETLAALRKPPSVFISASATGYYGDRGDRILRESDPPGEGFLPEVCVQWEGASEPAAHAGIRVAHIRTGLVLTPAGGALEPLLLPFSLGLGGPVGNGKQWWSFVALDDLLYLIHHVLMNEKVHGPVNATSPEPVTNADFAKTLGRVLSRPAFIPVPRFALELALGGMAGPLLFASTRVNPEKLLDTGFEFAYPSLESALRHELGRM